MIDLLSRFPSLRFGARVLAFALIALPLGLLAKTIGSDIPRMSGVAAALVITAFGCLVAITLVVVKHLFRTVP